MRVRNVACGLCGTDVSFFKATTGTNSALEPIPGSKRTFLGHENVGVVTEVGKDVTDFKVGDRVTIRAYMAGCDTKGIRERCHYCEEGDYNFCLNYGAPSPYGEVTTGAGWSDSFIYPARGLAHIYDELTDEQAVMVEPTCVSIHSVLCAPPQKGEKVLVMGCGAIGLGVVQAIKIVQPDCEVWVLERVPRGRSSPKSWARITCFPAKLRSHLQSHRRQPRLHRHGRQPLLLRRLRPRLRLRGRRLVQPHRRAPPARPRHAGEDRPPHARRHLR